MERRTISIRGTVQGVGFRPFVYSLATRLGLGGFVRNEAGSVCIEVEGDTPALDEFLVQLRSSPPPLARIDEMTWLRQSPIGQRTFQIDPSDTRTAGPIVVSADVATCDDCLREMLDPCDRRHAYPFLNCTNCGPRLTIVTGAPYDRQRTTMASFTMCPACQAEYDDPTNRRFHAQPIACPTCGPRLSLLDTTGRTLNVADPLAHFAQAILGGKIGAMKGLGGYHLVCDATNSSAVTELRRRKHRDEKPLAIMVSDVDTARQLCHVSDMERSLLNDVRRPIVLLRRYATAVIADSIAPGNPFLGIMLPYTPLHHLLMRHVDARPLVMTSGNSSDEPIAYQDDEALARLHDIADLFLIHNRPIHVRCDDSVTRIVGQLELPIRRSRGYAPQPIRLPIECSHPILAVGGQLKNAFAIGQYHQAILSHHMGDLDHYDAYCAFERDISLFEQLFAVQPALIAHDLHPDYASTRYAQHRCRDQNLSCIAVQHHHAHMASCMAEHGLSGPVIGVSLDGTGYGTDGAIWGGEFLVGDYRAFHRAAHLRYVGLPGGDRAIREPWRVAQSYLLDANQSLAILEHRIAPESLQIITQMLARQVNCPMTSSAGRLFDAVASLAGIRDRVSYEGQAAMELEWLATSTPIDGSYPFELTLPQDLSHSPITIDMRPTICAIVDDVRSNVISPTIARRFQSTMVDMIAAVCRRIRQSSGPDTIVLSGGVFLNALLTEEVTSRLHHDGFHVYRHRLVPPNDAGLSLGQLAIAACRGGPTCPPSVNPS